MIFGSINLGAGDLDARLTSITKYDTFHLSHSLSSKWCHDLIIADYNIWLELFGGWGFTP